MKQKVFWHNPKNKNFLALKGKENCKFLIIGGGVTGVSLAYFLNIQGEKNIILIEKSKIAGGATGCSAGMLMAGMENVGISPFLKKFGKKKTNLYFQKQSEAYEEIKKIIRTEKIACEAREGPYFVLGSKQWGVKQILQEYRARKKLDQNVDLLNKNDIERELGTKTFSLGEKVHNFAVSFNPLKYTQELARISSNRGVKIYEHTPLLRQNRNIVITPQGIIQFETIVYATDSFFSGNDLNRIKTTIGVTNPISVNQIRALKLTTPMLFEDSEKRDYHYVKMTTDNRILVGYGGMKMANSELTPILHKPHLRNIKRFIIHVFPQLKLKIEYAWSGIFASPAKSFMPLIKFKGNKILLLGSGTQVFSTMMAKYVAGRLSKKKQSLDIFFR